MRESVGRYLRSLWEDHASGEAVAETSGYGALQGLLNDAGRELDPSVRAIVNIRNRGAGIPDGGLFTADQLRRRRGGSAGTSGSKKPARWAGSYAGLAAMLLLGGALDANYRAVTGIEAAGSDAREGGRPWLTG